MNLLITGAWQMAESLIPTIEEMGHKVCYLPFEKDALPCEYEWVEGIIGNGIFLSHPIERFANLRYIQLTSAGLDRVPMGYIEAHGIAIQNARGVYSVPMAEYAVGSVLSLYKEQRFFARKQREHTWEKKRDLKELAGQAVCILGCGSVGTECARRFAAFDCTVWGVDIVPGERKFFSCIYPLNEVKKVLSKSDVVVITLPLTEETFHMFNAEMFTTMKRGAVIVNIARGAVIDTEALILTLKEKQLGGAILDVFEKEPLMEKSPLWDMENVIITPHNSFVGDGNDKRISDLIMKNLECMI